MRAPGGATRPISSLRVASSGAMNAPAGITSSSMTANEVAAAIGSSASASRIATAWWTRSSGGRRDSEP